MSSQTSGGSNNNASGVVSGGGVNNAPPGQSGSGSGNSVKSNSKMSIDHQATLDKGLKMKIKRTKTGTKTSEAKHEIVKATEQQNGILGASSGCNANLDENNGGSSSNTSNCGPNSSSNNSGTNLPAGITSNSNGNKKHVGSNNSNQSNSHNSSNNTSMMSSGGGTGISNNSQGTPQGTKRGSSGHRRDKTKEKNAHSNRVNVDKSTSQSNEKETGEKLTCQCNGDIIGANNSVPCSNNLCVRRSENNKLPERMTNSNSNTISNASVPPGVFTPTVDNLSASGTSASANILTATTTVSSATIAQASSNSGGTNAPGPPNKDNPSTGSGNMKVSPHIAAQLAAAAVSNTFSSSTPNSGGTNISNTNSISSDLKTSSSSALASGNGNSVQGAKHMAPGLISATMHHTISVPVTSHSSTIQHGTTTSGSPPKLNCGNPTTNLADETSRSPPAKRTKHSSAGELNTAKEMVDICVGTSVGTITEPDCLGPCEPGTSVTLEGIVWHETEGGVLVVNVTWRGKTYVGTLLDCTRHDWAPPRFCDSPTEELDSRTPKGRGKRGRSAAITPDLSNFTETRSSIYFSHAQVHSKLRNGSTKGGRAAARTSTSATSGSSSIVNTSNNTGSMSSGNGNGGTTPSTSPTAFLPPRPEKRKSKDEPPSPVNGENETLSLNMVNASGIPISASGGGLATQPQSLLNPVTGLNVQINTKKCKTASPCAISPVLLECPEQDCSKKYKHANGLRYHQSHAHGGVASMDEDSLQLPEIEDPPSTPSPGPTVAPPPAITPNSTDIPGTVTSSNTSNVTVPHSSTQESSTVTTFGNSTANSSSESTVCTSRSISNIPQTTPSASLLVTANAQAHEQISGVPSAGGSITAGTSNQALTQQKQQLVELATVTSANVSNVTPLEQSQPTMLQHGPTAKSGVLRFGQQNESKSSNANLLTGSLQSLPVTSQQTSTSSASNPSSLPEPTPIRPISASVGNDFNSQLTSNTSQAPMPQQNITMASKSISSFGLVGKQKKNRKSPCPGEYDEGGVSGNNITSRDDVQSPAYSDISDDSTPIQDTEALEKNQSTKHIDLLKKPQEIEMSGSGGNISAGQHSLPPSLGGYNMYQFFQQQQFIVQPSAEQQQLNKPTIPTGIVQPSNQISTQQSSQHSQSQLSNAHNLQQQQTSNHLDYSNKTKDPPLDLITKNVANQQQPHQIQDSNKSQDLTMPTQTNTNNMSNSGPVPSCGNLSANLNSLTSLGPSGLPQPAPSKSMSHFYPFNYIPSGYPYSVDSNYGPVSIVSSDDSAKLGGHASAQSPVEQGSQQQIPAAMIKEERTKESHSPQENLKPPPHINPNKMIKSEPITKQEPNKMESAPNVNVVTSQQVPQQPLALHPKDMQTYTSIYQRHPISLAPQQLSREEELRRYYVFSDQQRRQNNAMQSLNVNSQQLANVQSGGHHKEESNVPPQQISMPHPQQQLKHKQNSSNVTGASVNKVTNLSKDSPKQKPDEEIKINKQEGQKPTMETQGPPPPPTSQYFLHPSYIAPTPFGFDPNHPMYRNVLMSAAPYNTQPYHLPIPRYHAPEDLSRNTSTKALDALHAHAAQYYTTHKIHELSERALKSPNSGGNNSNNNNPGAVKVSVSSPNIGPAQQNNSGSNIVPHHSNTNQSNNSGLLNMPTHNAHGGPTNKQQDVLGHKQHGPNGPVGPGTSLNETQKQQSANSSNVPGNGAGSGNNTAGANASDSRSPPPQRHVHTHHHTHVGLGYPMYPAPYGAAVLASQQAAAVAVINPFPPAPSK